jgi:hypothetical protein
MKGRKRAGALGALTEINMFGECASSLPHMHCFGATNDRERIEERINIYI